MPVSQVGEERKALYPDLEDRSDREKLPNALLFQTLHSIIDQGRRKGHVS